MQQIILMHIDAATFLSYLDAKKLLHLDPITMLLHIDVQSTISLPWIKWIVCSIIRDI